MKSKIDIFYFAGKKRQLAPPETYINNHEKKSKIDILS